jgi:hypothetical protein
MHGMKLGQLVCDCLVTTAIELNSYPPCPCDRLPVEVCGQCFYTDISIQQRDPSIRGTLGLNVLCSVTKRTLNFQL